MSILDTFCAVDLETTGLDPRTAEVIEVGAVRVVSGKVADRFHSYVKPRGPIPEEISRLTGVTEDEVKDAPSSREVMELLSGMVEGLPVMGYQGRFEQRFLTAFLPGGVEVPPVHSVRDLARAALPRLNDHSAQRLADWFEVDLEEDGRKALADADRLAGAYLGTVETLRSASLSLKQQMVRLLKGTQSDLLPVVVQLEQETVAHKQASEPGGEGLRELINVGGREPETSPGAETPLDVDSVRELFEEEGLFEQEMKEYEHRPQQLEMAVAVSEAFNKDGILAVEAGTGVGKSMAYLVPAIQYAVQNSARVVISTNTKNLQEQLFYKDIPELDRILDVPFRYALVKGRSNYICLNRWGAALSSPDSVFTDSERASALPLVVWADQTTTGDISENTSFDTGRNASLWAKVCSEPGMCRSQRCRTNGRCFANVIRKEAQRSHVVVVNHSLLFSDMSSENGILGEFDHLILDEAHHIERVAAHFLGRELTVWRVRNLTDQLRSPGLAGTGTLPALRHWIAAADIDAATLKTFESACKAAILTAEELQENALAFFEDLTDAVRARNGTRRGSYSEKIRYRSGETPFGEISNALDMFESSCKDMLKRLGVLVQWLDALPSEALPNRDELQSELEGRVAACTEILNDLGYLAAPDDAGAVYWMELPVRENSSDTRLFAAPLNVARLLRAHLYDQKRMIVLTSATLSISGRLKYFLNRMGLDDIPDRVTSLCLGSPFDFERQALVCTPTFVPSPKSEGFQESVEDVLRSLSLGVRRGTLVLFTSYSMLNRAYGALKLDLQSESIRLLGQGVDGTPSQLMERFRTEGASVLFGTDSFWEGVDVPGEALEVLAIVRLPFAVPSEPLVAARLEELEKEGKNPFMHYSVPEAILKFRQGFGRLIRNGTDRGVVIVLDSRIVSTRYGRAFLDSLPAAHRNFDSLDSLVETVQEFFNSDNGLSRTEDAPAGEKSPALTAE